MPVGQPDLQSRLRGFFSSDPPDTIGVAVSGGGDSVALLHLISDWAKEGGPGVKVVTVNHGLRTASANEAAWVAELCRGLHLPHDVLHWRDWDGSGNLMDAARRARMQLMADWAVAEGLHTIALGHTADDQAETFLMRLARGSGVDGLSAMAPMRQAMGVNWVRPLLFARRTDLRDHLRGRGLGWIDDPTNDDPRFDRIKTRQALAALEPLGITPDRIGSTILLLSLARTALQTAVQRFAQTAAQEVAGTVIVDRRALFLEPRETSLRFLAEAIRWVSTADYRPRLETLIEVFADVQLQRKRTLAGCILHGNGTQIRITREPKAVARTVCPTDQLWDNRWRVEGPHDAGLELRALGAEGLKACKDWRGTGISRDALLVTPAIWHDDTLMAAPLAGLPNGWSAEIPASFSRFIVSH